MVLNLKNNICTGGILFLTLLTAGCSTVNLSPDGIDRSEAAQARGRAILLSTLQKRDPDNRWSGFRMMKIIASDNWPSWMDRASTPIPQNNQQLQWALNLKNGDAAAKYLDGKKAGQIFGLEAGRTYFVDQGKRTDKPSTPVKNYLSQVRDYFLWPQSIVNFDQAFYMGESKIRSWSFDRIFVSDGGPNGPAGSDDTYIVWVNRLTEQIDFIEFQLRRSGHDCRGTVEYVDYRDVGGLVLPYQILLLKNMGHEEIAHRIYVEIYSFDEGL